MGSLGCSMACYLTRTPGETPSPPCAFPSLGLPLPTPPQGLPSRTYMSHRPLPRLLCFATAFRCGSPFVVYYIQSSSCTCTAVRPEFCSL